MNDHLLALRRHWLIVVGVALLCLALTAVLTMLTPREYRGEAQLFISTSGGDSVTDLAQGGSFTQRQVATYADVLTTPVVLEPVIAELGLDETPGQLAERTSATVPPGTVLIRVAVTDPDPTAAAGLADAIAGQFTETVQDLERVSEDGPSPVKATLVEPATVPTTPASPQPLRNLLLGTALGLLLGAGLALVRELVDTRVKGEADVRRVTDQPAIGAIAFDPQAQDQPLVVATDQHSPRAEMFRTLRTNLRYLDADDPPRTLVLTSTVPGEGKSTTTANLALALVETGASVCLIEGDLRRPRLLQYLGLENAAGLTDVLVGRAELEDVLQPYGDGGLTVLGSGPIPPNPSELLGSSAMERLLTGLRETYDFVILDSPPLLAVTDAAVLSTVADGVVLVVGMGLVRREQLQRALENLERVDAELLGLVHNRLPVKGPDAYHYAYESYAPDLPGDSRRSRRRTSGRARG